MVLRRREDSALPRKDWSGWKRAMVPDLTNGDSRSPRYYEPRSEGHPGYLCINIRTVFEEYKCGIYEWKVEGTETQQPTKEVYVGSTCRGKPGALQDRIMEYCSNGSHKSELIDDALEKGYELWARVKPSGRSKVRAEDLENDLLSKYNYAWNIRDNIGVRDVLRP
jgi:hypothetical protein